MADNNLTFSISADSSRFEVAAQRTKAALNDLSKEMTRLRNEAQKTGDWSGVEALAPALAKARVEARAANAAIRGLGTTAAETSGSFSDLSRSVSGFARAAGLATAGTRALRIGLLAMVGAEVVHGFTQVVDKVNDLNDLSKKTGFDPATIQAFGDALGKTGAKAEDAAGVFDKLASHAKLGADIYGKTFLEADDALKALNINLSRLRPGTAEFFGVVAQALVKLHQAGKVDEANLRSTEILGKNYNEIGKALEVIAAATAKQAGTGIASPETLAAAEKYRIAVAELSKTWDEFASHGVSEGAVLIVNALTGLIEIFAINIPNAIRTTIEWFQKLIDTAKDAAAFVGIGTGSGGDYGGGGGFASGGYVRGPGSGTSDSILARLSNGEFVMRASAVDRWGPQFLNALNNMRNPFDGFAGGGLVSARSIPAFAGGGMVHTAGATVNLVFPGGTFALRADNETVGALTREARRAGMLSGGRRAGLLQ